uniref:Uncharacterized protein n=1 Tax=Anguilla anguilla TaxID=7936 RepID=A0A0E9S7A8_ANGAN
MLSFPLLTDDSHSLLFCLSLIFNLVIFFV